MRLVRLHFFGLQYHAKNHPGVIPVVNVDHPLDADIPYNPAWVTVYHDFSAFWVRCAARMAKAGFTDTAAAFTGAIGDLYVEAARVYRQCMSTTVRPRYFGNTGCAIIQIFDPHLMCIPSLHVLVCVRTWLWARKTFETGGSVVGSAADPAFAASCFAHAVLITESILYLKQHSLNCISASLYVLRCLDGALFSAEDAARFINALFAGRGYHQELVHIDELRGFLHESLAAFDERRAALDGTDGWTQPLIEFLEARRQR